MREPSLRPERSASANSATSAFFLRTEFYRKDCFCQPKVNFFVHFILVAESIYLSRLKIEKGAMRGTKCQLVRHVYVLTMLIVFPASVQAIRFDCSSETLTIIEHLCYLYAM